jgi:hypothetical protein
MLAATIKKRDGIHFGSVMMHTMNALLLGILATTVEEVTHSPTTMFMMNAINFRLGLIHDNLANKYLGG